MTVSASVRRLLRLTRSLKASDQFAETRKMVPELEIEIVSITEAGAQWASPPPASTGPRP